jgi:hypothetical protein
MIFLLDFNTMRLLKNKENYFEIAKGIIKEHLERFLV